VSLVSKWFRENERLQRCLVSDPAHVQKGDSGDHVGLIQGSLQILNHAQIANDELEKQLYGVSTAKAVLDYKKKRQIINYSYQTQADNIVGKMTIRALDTEMAAHERGTSRLLFALGVKIPQPRISIITQNHPLPAQWARQFVAAHKPNVIPFRSPRKGTPEQNIKVIKEAIKAANGGGLIFSVGHGIIEQGFKDQGGFDCADDRALRLGGRGSFVNPVTFVDVFYDDKPPAGSTIRFSPKELDERVGGPGAKRRLKNWALYLDLCKAFAEGNLGAVLLLTCNVGGAPLFLKKVASQWKTAIVGYNEFTSYQGGFPKRRVRAIFFSDLNKQGTPNPGSNTPFAEIMFPLSLSKMVVAFP